MRSTLCALSLALWTAFSLSCATTGDRTITYPAGLLAEHPEGFYRCYVRLVGVVTFSAPADQFPPFSRKDPLLCDSSGCVYLRDDTQDLTGLAGKKVKVLGYVGVSRFYFTYVEVEEVEEVKE